MRRSSAYAGRVTALLGLLCGGCALPEAFEVTKGEEPRNVDSQVRFRTTYYFRVLDVCESAMGTTTDNTNVFSDKRGTKLRTLKDSLYRFRMTGKASSLFSQVHFESGTLKSYQIEPFGANVAYDDTNNRFYLKSQLETQEDAREAVAFAKFEKYRKLLDDLPTTSPFRAEIAALTLEELRGLGGSQHPPTVLRVAQRIDQLVQDAKTAAVNADRAALAARKAVGTDGGDGEITESKLAALVSKSALSATDLQQTLDALGPKARPILEEAFRLARLSKDQAVTAHEKAMASYIESQASVDKATDAITPQAASDLSQNAQNAKKMLDQAASQLAIASDQARTAGDKLSQLVALIVAETVDGAAAIATTGAADDCQSGSRKRRGFQILGPEGLRTFDQDERLIMAMSSDGKPLISVMQDLSGRILNQKSTPEQQLLPLSRERLRVTETLRTLDRQKASIAQGSGTASQDDAATKAIHAVVEAFSPSKGANR